MNLNLILRGVFGSLTVCGLSLFTVQPPASASHVTYKQVNANKQQILTLGLKGRNQTELTKFIYQTVTPGSHNYRKYLTPQQFGLRYGLSDRKVKQVGKFMRAHNLKANTYPGNIVMTVSGKTKDIEKVFHLKLIQTTNLKKNYQTTNGQDKIPHRIRPMVNFIDQPGLRAVVTSKTVNPSSSVKKILSKVRDPNIRDRSYKKFGRTYNTSPLYANGNGGQGQTIGIIGNADFKMSDVEQYLKKSGVHSNFNRIHKVLVSKGLSKQNDDREEVTMDVEQASAIAPKARVNAYLSGDISNGLLINSYATAIGRDNVDVISSSYGSFESDTKSKSITKGEVSLLNRLLMQAAAQGITTFNAAGDNGAYAFQSGSKATSVGLPASSPYIVAVGGTTLPFKNILFSELAAFKLTKDKRVSLPRESAWSNSTSVTSLFGAKYIYDQTVNNLYANAKTEAEKEKVKNELNQELASIAQQQKNISPITLYQLYNGSGGGFSSYFSRPKYQSGVSGVGTYKARQFLNLTTGQFNPTAKLVTGKHSGRNLPDISGNADPLTGYNVYFNGKVDPFGDGTSVITPQMAAMAAVINSFQGKRTGFWNPQIYRFARQAKSPFTSLNHLTDNNLYYTGQPGKIYNQATGLGTVNFTRLNQAFTNAH
ncbi:protease pro-enzyme activation domain-containing protein [Lactobacillus sp. Sy-1]|uniref:S53 family peptidase n=1 Tax=Lactobacillus sp. Sy-1 TaxID=2109645 RepID=UPI001C57C3BD|nr:S53 family peptidase [Lactobacillus sp. Sy-1]MBW1604866.1 S8/S53 family peptidase [Lactobacillus sp. Sy-1]